MSPSVSVEVACRLAICALTLGIAVVVSLFQWHRIVPHKARLRGWAITPSHFVNNQLDTVWLAPE